MSPESGLPWGLEGPGDLEGQGLCFLECKDALEEARGWRGGKWGSGKPASLKSQRQLRAPGFFLHLETRDVSAAGNESFSAVPALPPMHTCPGHPHPQPLISALRRGSQFSTQMPWSDELLGTPSSSEFQMFLLRIFKWGLFFPFSEVLLPLVANLYKPQFLICQRDINCSSFLRR